MRSPLDLLYPPRCLFCGKILREEKNLCWECRNTAPWYPDRKTKREFLDSVTAVWYYKENVRRGLLRYKFGHRLNMAAGFGRFLAAVIQRRYPEGFDILTWVPTSEKRRFDRGYDQAKLLAAAVGRELGRKPRRLLRKFRNNPAQSGISDAAGRRANVMGVYRLAGHADLKGKRILLIDDILTTGATAGECARVLKAAGAAEVHCAAVAASSRD